MGAPDLDLASDSAGLLALLVNVQPSFALTVEGDEGQRRACGLVDLGKRFSPGPPSSVLSPRPASQCVRTAAAHELVIAAHAGEQVRRAVAADRVVAIRPDHYLDGLDRVLFRTGSRIAEAHRHAGRRAGIGHRVRAGSAVDAVGAGAAQQKVVARAAEEVEVTLTPEERVVVRAHAVGHLVLGELAIDYEHRRVTVGGDPVDLTATEYELLRLLSLDAGRVVTFDALLRRVWPKRENAGPNLVRIFVGNLRRKLGDSAASPAYIFNHRGVGYRMGKPPGG